MKLLDCFRKMLKSKKGVAIETAIATSIVVFSLCSILLMTAVFSARDRERIERDFQDRAVACEIAEHYISWRSANEGSEDTFDYSGIDEEGVFSMNVETAGGVTTVVIRKNSTLLLTVELDSTNKVILWQYGK